MDFVLRIGHLEHTLLSKKKYFIWKTHNVNDYKTHIKCCQSYKTVNIRKSDDTKRVIKCF